MISANFEHRTARRTNQRILKGELPVTTKVKKEYQLNIHHLSLRKKVVTSSGVHRVVRCMIEADFYWLSETNYIIHDNEILMSKEV